jgi:hypothetical protein
MLNSNESCIICMENIGPDKTKKLACTHSNVIHQKCLQNWSQTSNTCPLCRVPLKDSNSIILQVKYCLQIVLILLLIVSFACVIGITMAFLFGVVYKTAKSINR